MTIVCQRSRRRDDEKLYMDDVASSCIGLTLDRHVDRFWLQERACVVVWRCADSLGWWCRGQGAGFDRQRGTGPRWFAKWCRGGRRLPARRGGSLRACWVCFVSKMKLNLRWREGGGGDRKRGKLTTSSTPDPPPAYPTEQASVFLPDAPSSLQDIIHTLRQHLPLDHRPSRRDGRINAYTLSCTCRRSLEVHVGLFPQEQV
jgi:hypothetical protein